MPIALYALTAGAWLGGVVIAQGLGLGAVTWVAALLPLAAFGVALMAIRLNHDKDSVEYVLGF